MSIFPTPYSSPEVRSLRKLVSDSSFSSPESTAPSPDYALIAETARRALSTFNNTDDPELEHLVVDNDTGERPVYSPVKGARNLRSAFDEALREKASFNPQESLRSITPSPSILGKRKAQRPASYTKLDKWERPAKRQCIAAARARSAMGSTIERSEHVSFRTPSVPVRSPRYTPSDAPSPMDIATEKTEALFRNRSTAVPSPSDTFSLYSPGSGFHTPPKFFSFSK